MPARERKAFSLCPKAVSGCMPQGLHAGRRDIYIFTLCLLQGTGTVLLRDTHALIGMHRSPASFNSIFFLDLASSVGDTPVPL